MVDHDGLTGSSPLCQAAGSLSRLPLVALGDFVHVGLLPRHLLHEHLRVTNSSKVSRRRQPTAAEWMLGSPPGVP